MSERELSQNGAPEMSANLTSAPTQAASEQAPDAVLIGPYRLLTSAYNGLKEHATHIPAHNQYELARAADRLAQLNSEQNKTAEAQKWREVAAHP